MKLCYNKMLYSLSSALDRVEMEHYELCSFHSKRIAYYSYLMGKALHLKQHELTNLTNMAFLHDNGLTEFYKRKYNSYEEYCQIHCLAGERNIIHVPFYEDVKNVILYHHESIDGSGPFGKKGDDIPLFSQIIHICDWSDLRYHFHDMDELKYKTMIEDIKKHIDKEFNSIIVHAFEEAITYDVIVESQKQRIDHVLKSLLVEDLRDIQSPEVMSICHLFTSIVDSKSPTTRAHSIGVARRAVVMGMHYRYDKEKISKLFFAGAMHDIGKLLVSRDILEKPDQLTDSEFIEMKSHAYHTYEILKQMDLEDVAHWASYHHEKLDGSGYPFGLTAEHLDFEDRLLACCDIYQALVEERPYKKGYTHNEAIHIMKDMVDKGQIEETIVNDMDIVFDHYDHYLKESS